MVLRTSPPMEMIHVYSNSYFTVFGIFDYNLNGITPLHKK